MSSRREWGIWLHAVRPVPELVELAVHAEKRGASLLLVADEGTDRDVYVTLTAIAAQTTSLWLATGITNPHSRHPVATAAAFASLAEVAPGRVIAGFGAGGTLVLGPMGLRPARPFTALAETIDVVDALLDGQLVHHAGEFAVDGARLPWSPGRLPLAVAGRGPRAQQLASERGDWVFVAGKPVADVPSLSQQLRAEALAGGRDVRLVWNPGAAWHPAHAEEIRSHLSYMTVDMPAQWRDRLGVTAQEVEALRAALAESGPQAAGPLVPDSVVEAFSIVGDRDAVRQRLAEIAEQAQPDLLVFDLHETTAGYIDEIAALVEEMPTSSACPQEAVGVR